MLAPHSVLPHGVDGDGAVLMRDQPSSQEGHLLLVPHGKLLLERLSAPGHELSHSLVRDHVHGFLHGLVRLDGDELSTDFDCDGCQLPLLTLRNSPALAVAGRVLEVLTPLVLGGEADKWGAELGVRLPAEPAPQVRADDSGYVRLRKRGAQDWKHSRRLLAPQRPLDLQRRGVGGEGVLPLLAALVPDGELFLPLLLLLRGRDGLGSEERGSYGGLNQPFDNLGAHPRISNVSHRSVLYDHPRNDIPRACFSNDFDSFHRDDRIYLHGVLVNLDLHDLHLLRPRVACKLLLVLHPEELGRVDVRGPHRVSLVLLLREQLEGLDLG
mmetsp:Transcript_14157/g.25939  ORF Transcript_14157/g.25939 Transcript_14157/m.25939 type:complete len:326 (-) Transcript_14157:852-1829(-)